MIFVVTRIIPESERTLWSVQPVFSRDLQVARNIIRSLEDLTHLERTCIPAYA